MAHCGHGNCKSTTVVNDQVIRCCGPEDHEGPHLNIPGYYLGTENEPRALWE